MTTVYPERWPIARYRFEFRVTKEMRWPDYAGSAIRGAFGRALRKTACMTHQEACPTCPLFRTCPYAAIFETPAPATHVLQKFSQVPHPYVIEAPAWGRHVSSVGDIFSFHVVLIGRARMQLPLIIYAMQRAFAHDVVKGSAALESVHVETVNGFQCIFSEETRTIAEHQNDVAVLLSDKPRDVVLSFLTHLRLQNNGRPLGIREIEPGPFFNALVRRTSLLMEFHAEPIRPDFTALALAAKGLQFRNELRWQNWTRFSSRQNQKMQLNGVTGRYTIEAVPSELQLFLRLGEWLHVGKNASFGLGHYTADFDLSQKSKLPFEHNRNFGKALLNSNGKKTSQVAGV